LDDANEQAHVALMQTFSGSVGACETCHGGDFGAPTDNKTITRHMWEDIVARFELADGGLLYCDSCHQGQARFLDRSNREAVELWMQENMVDKLVRRDGQPNSCASCHGDPPNYDLTSKWLE
jgi:hypothetical protein